MCLPCYQFGDVGMAAEEREGKKALPSNLITPAIQDCLFTSRPDNKQELIHMLMQMG